LLEIAYWVQYKIYITKMNNTRSEYNKRIHEVELYLDTLKMLDDGHCSIKCVDILGNETVSNIDAELSTILKANGFLLLYNLIEATIRKSIDAVLNSIHSSSISFKVLSDKLQTIWLKQETKGLSLANNQDKIMLMIKTILDNEFLSFKRDCIDISGNIDAQKIRDILKQIGGNEISDGRELKIIKDKRNNLAHGEFTFSEIGRDVLVSELIEYKNKTKDYLSNVLAEINDYIESQKYLK